MDHRLHLSPLQSQKAELTSSKTQISSANDTESYIFELCLLATACPEMSLIRMRMLRGWYSSSFKLEITLQNAWLTEKVRFKHNTLISASRLHIYGSELRVCLRVCASLMCVFWTEAPTAINQNMKKQLQKWECAGRSIRWYPVWILKKGLWNGREVCVVFCLF